MHDPLVPPVPEVDNRVLVARQVGDMVGTRVGPTQQFTPWRPIVARGMSRSGNRYVADDTIRADI